MLPKKGKDFPSAKSLGPFPLAISYALKRELGSTHQAVKTIMRWTGAGERTAKNWLSGNSGPSGEHLVDLMRHCDGVLEVMLILAGRPRIMAAQRLADIRNELAETVDMIDAVIADGEITH